jgi:hypothetical protein
VFEAWKAKPFLQTMEERARHRGKDQVGCPNDEEDLHVLEGVGRNDFPLARKFDAGDHVGKGRVFDEIDDLVPATGKGQPQCLRQNDGADHAEPAESQGLGGMELAPPDGEKGPSNILRMVGPAAQGKANDRRHEGGEVDSDVRKSEIPDEKLDHQGEPPEDGHITIGKPRNPSLPIHPQSSHTDPDDKTGHCGGDDELDADQEPSQQCRHDLLNKEDLFHVSGILHRAR